MSRLPMAGDFAVLGLRPGASDEEIRAAYRRLAKIHHPDFNPGDARALATFRRISESYAALRGHSAAQAQVSPLSASRANRRRASARRGGATMPVRIAELAVGGSSWVDSSAILVAPDRAVTLRPDATGTPFPSAERVIRVERREAGLHLFLPPQPQARWVVGAQAETGGMAVAALWVGERQDTRLPGRLVGGRVGEMRVGGRGWTSAAALAAHHDGRWSIDLEELVSDQPHRAMRLRVLHDVDGYRVHSELPASAWPPGPPPGGAARGGVIAAILAGTRYPQPQPAS